MSPEAAEVLAASVFASEAASYWREVAEQADLARAFLALEREADAAQKRLEGEVWARAVGAACAVDLTAEASLWALLLYSPDVAVRTKAADLIVRKIQGTRRAA